MQCPECGKENGDGAVFCLYCRRILPLSPRESAPSDGWDSGLESAPPDRPVSGRESAQQCPKCGKDNPDKTWLCPYCGQTITRSSSDLSPEERKLRTRNRTLVVISVCGGLLVVVLLAMSAALKNTPGTTRSLSDYEKRKLYYDMIATQDQNPYTDSENWNAYSQGVKDAAAKKYNVPMSEINEIIHEGATEHWLQPTPP